MACTFCPTCARALEDGRVAEQWCLLDELGRLQQLGASPPTKG